MNLDVRDAIWLVASTGLSAVVFMGLWAIWLKTQEAGFRKYAFFLAPLPLGLTVLAMLFRGGEGPAVVGYFHTSVEGPGPVTREVAIPVANASAKYVVELEPVIQDVEVKGPNGSRVVAHHAVLDEKRFIFFDAKGEGAYLLVLQIPKGVDKVDIVSMQNH